MRRMSLHNLKSWLITKNFLMPFVRCYYKIKIAALKKELYIPKEIYIETTNFCNIKCICCPHEKITRKKGYMPWDIFKKIIDECASFEGDGLRILLHKDGEPLLDPLLFQRIEYSKTRLPKTTVCFHSNAMALDQSKSEKLLNSKIDGITFSINGTSKNTCERLQVGLNYDVVKENLDRFFTMRLKSRRKVPAAMQMVVCEENKHEIEEYKRLWLNKADAVIFKPMHSFLDMGTSITTKKLKTVQIRCCIEPFESLFIYWNGDIGLCCWDYDNFAHLGNIRDETILNVYNNEKFKAIREAMCRMDCAKVNPCNKCSVIYGLDRVASSVDIF